MILIDVLWKLRYAVLATTFIQSVLCLVVYEQYEQLANTTACNCNKDDAAFVLLTLSEIICALSCTNTDDCVSFDYSYNSNQCFGCRITSQSQLAVPRGHTCWKVKRQPRDCLDVLNRNKTAEDGIYTVTTSAGTKVDVNCIMSKNGGGWTVMLKRFNGDVPFNRTFREYDLGFGDQTGEHWLGLRYIHELTVGRQSDFHLLFAGGGINNLTPDREEYEEWSDFSIGPEPNYTLHIGSLNNWTYEYFRTASDLLNISNGLGFSTQDFDRDLSGSMSSSQKHGSGGWWYRDGTSINPTGIYFQPGTMSPKSMYSLNLMSTGSLKNATLMFRRRDSN